MLQQTTVKAVIPYYERFLARWPTVEALAAATLDDVLGRLGGARLLQPRAQSAQVRADRRQGATPGAFPRRRTACASCRASGPTRRRRSRPSPSARATTPVDGNIERVVARLFAVKTPLPAAKPEIRRLARTLTPARRAGDFAQALMDLGASVCTPKRPSCLMCPLQGECAAHCAGPRSRAAGAGGKAGAAGARRHRLSRPARGRRTCCCAGARRPACSAACWRCPRPSGARPCRRVNEALRGAPVRGDWWAVPGVVSHTFTHFRLETLVYRAIVPADATLTFWADPQRCHWVARRDLDRAALPSVMRKIIAHGLREQ